MGRGLSMDDPVRPEFVVESGWMNAAGMFGFAPPANWPLELPPVAFVTDPISYKPRSPAHDRSCLPYPGGMILHTGWPNPGFRRVMLTYGKRWARSNVPIWVHLLTERPYEVDKMVRWLEEAEGVAAVEIDLPNAASDSERLELVESALGELPLVLCVPLDQVNKEWVARVVETGVSAISISAPRGVLPSIDGSTVRGRCYGPGLLPLALQALNCLRDVNLPFIAGCGVYGWAAYETMLKAGAVAVKLDTVLWRGMEARVED